LGGKKKSGHRKGGFDKVETFFLPESRRGAIGEERKKFIDAYECKFRMKCWILQGRSCIKGGIIHQKGAYRSPLLENEVFKETRCSVGIHHRDLLQRCCFISRLLSALGRTVSFQ
jgi:hypothetical protein